MEKCYWVYILYCDNDTYYTGYTHDLAKRYQSHVDGTGKCKYTRSFKPLRIAQCWKVVGEKSLAMRLEREIKKLTRAEKEEIILDPAQLSNAPYVEVCHIQEILEQRVHHSSK